MDTVLDPKLIHQNPKFVLLPLLAKKHFSHEETKLSIDFFKFRVKYFCQCVF